MGKERDHVVDRKCRLSVWSNRWFEPGETLTESALSAREAIDLAAVSIERVEIGEIGADGLNRMSVGWEGVFCECRIGRGEGE